MKEYNLHKIIGEGATSTIYSAFFLKDNKKEEVAIKILKNTPRNISHFETERTKLQTLQHPNIIKIFDSHKSKNHLYIVMEKMEMTLTQYISENFLYDNFNEENDEEERKEYFKKRERKVIKIMRMVLLGINYMHENNVIHRDIKLGNILVNSKTVKISDFGLATEKTTCTSFCGTEDYLAPEIEKEKVYNKKVDIYSAGLVLFILLTNKKFDESLIRNIEYYERLAFYSNEVKDVLIKMLLKNPNDRISSVQALKHNAFKEYFCFPPSFINLDDITYSTDMGSIKKEGNTIHFQNIMLRDKNFSSSYSCGCINYAKGFNLQPFTLKDLLSNELKLRDQNIEILINSNKHTSYDIPHGDLKKIKFLEKFLNGMLRKIIITKIIGEKFVIPLDLKRKSAIGVLDLFIKNSYFERKSNGDFIYLRMTDQNNKSLLFVELKGQKFIVKKINLSSNFMQENNSIDKYNLLNKPGFIQKRHVEVKFYEKIDEIIKISKEFKVQKDLDRADQTILEYFLSLTENHFLHECVGKQKISENLLTRFSTDRTTQFLDFSKNEKIEFKCINDIWIIMQKEKWRFLLKEGQRIEIAFFRNQISDDFIFVNESEEIMHLKFEENLSFKMQIILKNILEILLKMNKL